MANMTREAAVPQPMVDMAKRRTAGLFRQMQYSDTSTKTVLASAYIQGMHDLFETIEARGRLRWGR